MNAPGQTPPTLRLDEVLCQRHGYESRSRARDCIRRGCVSLHGHTLVRPGRMIAPDAALQINDPARRYVSRAALKLLHGLEASGFSPAGRTALDLGASTGGFTQVLLEQGALRVIAIDAGHDQMHEKLRADPRVSVHEGVNARDLDAGILAGEAPGFIVADLSFISLKLALPRALALAADGALGIFLVKPQFEAGRDAIGKGGLVRDPAVALATAQGVRDWLAQVAGWRVTGLAPSPIEGGDGNREYLLWAQKTGETEA